MLAPHDPDELSIEIDGKEFRFWTAMELSLVFDGHSSVSFAAPFEPESAEFRETFRPFSYKQTRVLLGGELLFTGTMIDVAPEVTPESRTVNVTAYAKAAVLQDVTPPASAHPLEFNKLKLLQIAEKLLSPFGLTASLGPGADEGARFERVKLDPKDKIQDFLVDLAKQRGLILGSDPEGNVVLKVERSTGQVHALRDSEHPVTGVSVSFAPQEYYSEVTVIAKAKHGKKGGKYTVKNPFLPGVNRPIVIELDKTEPGDVKTVASARLGRMFANAMTFEVDVAAWRNPDGDLWMPDQRISLTAENIMLYRPTELVVRGAKLVSEPDKSRHVSLACVLPGSFTGELPESTPWSE